MKPSTIKSKLAISASALLLAASFNTPSFAQAGGTTANGDEIISTGTRRKARSAADTPAPVDVISGVEFTKNAANDVQDLLRTAVPSYNVNTQPISDAATVIRPANLRGLSPDNTLVLLNGKRRHRGSVISFLGGGISDGAQGVDVSVFPSIALKQVEILRDGASSQYGSDAIAGVINFQLKDAPEGGSLEVKYGSTYDGDGDNYQIAGNIGFPLGDKGFINVSGEFGEQDGTVRSVVRGDVAGLIAAGNVAASDFMTINSYTDEAPQYWGQPDVEDQYMVFVNTGLELSDNAEVYAFGNYAERTVTGGFFYRNPTNRGGVYAGPQVNPATGNTVTADAMGVLIDDLTGATVAATVDSVRVGTLAGGAMACPRGIPLTQGGGLIPDPTILAQVSGDANCFSFVETIPGGFVPRFGGNNRDHAVTGGIRGELDFGNGLGYDISGSYGSSKTDFFIRNTLNASLGPDSPRDFVPGAYEQIETAFNLDLNYGIPIAGWASDLGVAAGFEWREEQFDITAGDPLSFALGPLAAPCPMLPCDGVEGFPTGQGFSSSSNGFGGFAESTSNTQSNIAIYGELEADVTEALTLQAALRWEDYDLFGTTTNWKVGGLYKINDNFRVRGTYSTGFHAPTAGQANVKNVTTQAIGGVLIDQGTIPLTSNPGQLAANFLENQFGVRPTLGPETADNLSFGVAFNTGRMEWTVDYFNIKVDDRIATTDNIVFLDALDFLAAQQNVAGYDNSTVASAIATLAAGGALNQSDYVGFEDLTGFRFFTNNFSTKTQGVDVVGRVPFDIGSGSSSVVVALNYTDTEVTNPGVIAPITANRIMALEELLPKWKGNVTLNHEVGMWRGLLRANYYGSWNDTGNGFDDRSAEIVVDAEIGAQILENVEIILGAANLLDNYPDENPDQLSIGQLYPESSPMGFNGGQYYLKGRVTF